MRSKDAVTAFRSWVWVGVLLLSALAEKPLFGQVVYGGTVGAPEPITVLSTLNSPDQIVYVFGDTERNFFTRSGPNSRQLTTGLRYPWEHVALSRNLRYIAASTTWQNNNTIPPKLYIIDLVGRNMYRLFTDSEFTVGANGPMDWDAAGNIYVGAMAAGTTTTDIYRVTWGTGAPPVAVTATQLVGFTDSHDGDCSVSADSRWLTFTREFPQTRDPVTNAVTRKQYNEIWMRSTAPDNGASNKRIFGNALISNVDDGNSAQNPVISPDGRKVIFNRANTAYKNFCSGSGSPCTAHDIFAISTTDNPDNPTTLTRLTKPGPISIVPSWSRKYSSKGTIVYVHLCDRLNVSNGVPVCGQGLGVDYMGLAMINATDPDQTPTLIQVGGMSPRWVP